MVLRTPPLPFADQAFLPFPFDFVTLPPFISLFPEPREPFFDQPPFCTFILPGRLWLR